MIIIGDVHGCYKTLLALIDKCPKGEEFCFVGDLVDRGPDSVSVVSLIKQQGWKCVQGNHEKMMADAVLNGRMSEIQLWMMNGGQQTESSYEGTGLDEAHAQWMRDLPLYLEFPEIVRDDGRHLFVSHAGLYQDDDSLQMAIERQTRNQDILWHRDMIHDYPELFQVFGHTPQANRARIENHFANLDTGAVFNRSPYGVMTALRFPQMEIFTQENIENLKSARTLETSP